ncbi:MAG: glucose-1-phosphate cytidylyltransferase [Pseudomonadota bacterium]|nr:glucose-1-phosphate cytidylyltransferase [Pseudomonadota bacterium]
MKAVILAGGLGTRFGEETDLKPKPMIEVGGMPILWHIMKMYSAHGIDEFVICLGYRGYIIKEFFDNYFLHRSDVTFDIRTNTKLVHEHEAEPWKVTLVDTGANTQTGGRIKRVRKYIGNETFFLTYGDGVADVDIKKSLEEHKAAGKLCTVTAVQPAGRFGAMVVDDSNTVTRFEEKPQGDGSWINGGFFVVEPKIFDLIDDDTTIWEQKPLKTLAGDKELNAFYHRGFWQPMDTLRDRRELEKHWASGLAPWKMWEK